MSLSPLPPVPSSAPSPDAPRAEAQRGGAQPEPGAFHAAVETATRDDSAPRAADNAPGAPSGTGSDAPSDKGPVTDATAPDRPAEAAGPQAAASGKDAPAGKAAVKPATPPTASEVAVKAAIPLADEPLATPLLAEGATPVTRADAEPVRRKAAAAATPVPAAAEPADTAVPSPDAVATPAAAVVVPAAVPQHAVQAGEVDFGEGAGEKTTAPAGSHGPGHAAGAAPAEPGATVADRNLPTAQFAQTLDAAPARPAALPYDAGARGDLASGTASATVALRAGHFGTDMGVAIARALEPGPQGLRDALLVRLDPREMGRIDVRMAFDGDGTLRAVVSADSPAALDLLRRESTQLDRALTDAGVRADGQSLRFEGGGGSGAGGQGQPGAQPRSPAGRAPSALPGDAPEGVPPAFRSLRGSGHLDVLA